MGLPVVYISTRGMMRAFERLGLESGRLCTYCIGGGHPFAGCEASDSAGESQLDLLTVSRAAAAGSAAG